jgi:hypothetical protein
MLRLTKTVIKIMEMTLEEFKKLLKNNAADKELMNQLTAEHLSDKELVLNILEASGQILEFCNSKFYGDKDVALAAVKIDGTNLYFLQNELKNNKEIVLAAVMQSGFALEWVSYELKEDREIILNAMKSYGYLEIVPEKYKDDEEIVLAAIESNHNLKAFRHASARLRNKLEVVEAAINKAGSSLEFVSDRFKNNKDIVLKAVNNSGYSLQYASEELRNDKEVVLAAVKKHADSLRYASEELKYDIDLVDIVINDKNGFSAFQYLAAPLRNNYELCLKACENNGGNIEYINEEFKKDKKIVLAALRAAKDTHRVLLQSLELKNQIGNNDPIEYLEKAILHEEMQNEILINKDENKKISKPKI